MEIQYNRWEIPSNIGNFTFSSGGITSRTASNDGTGDILATAFSIHAKSDSETTIWTLSVCSDIGVSQEILRSAASS